MENLGRSIQPSFLLSFYFLKKSCVFPCDNSSLNEKERVFAKSGQPLNGKMWSSRALALDLLSLFLFLLFTSLLNVPLIAVLLKMLVETTTEISLHLSKEEIQ